MVSCEVNSTHKVEVVPLVLERHPNADRLSVVKVYGYTCVTGTEQWGDAKVAAYIPPDSLVDVGRPEFSFLIKDARDDGKARIKAKKLRGVLSFGLLVPAPAGAQVGDDVTAQLGVQHYDPPAAGAGNSSRGGLYMSGEVASAPTVHTVKYDVEAGRRYAQQVFEPGEPVVVTEKIHGANARYVYHDGQMFCGSRTEWKKERPNYDHVTVESLVEGMRKKYDASKDKMGFEPVADEQLVERANDIIAKLKKSEHQQNMWWQALDATPSLRKFCESNPGVVVYGEVYGAVQDLNYGHEKGKVSFAAFDLMKDGQWLSFVEAYSLVHPYQLPWVPVLSAGHPDGQFVAQPFDFEKACEMAEGKSLVPGANHVREGVVVSPLRERWDHRVGRVKLKFVGAGYLEKSKETETPDEAFPTIPGLSL